ncbi:hypothetical protein [Pseudonocardia broussonetiae]|uniref:Uncharacterized protein n=1 Tax=Pseudonocardia broussonetiae TaxID=2736640 RepID=A0A6M6JP79_9PSEU|nr:hypothetical protein [Pseudonocardia broussonetiae]QJY49205.1 hypothetical protein HOP40_28465 [Pseudonocardia broussonetiae]
MVLSSAWRAALLDALANNGIVSPAHTRAMCGALEQAGLAVGGGEDWPLVGHVAVWRLTPYGRSIARKLRRGSPAEPRPEPRVLATAHAGGRRPRPAQR